ncbi:MULTISPECIES: hypothetical protein [unclassified Streptomyces]|uniref:hypothetical protein n=1 Tax=unclassified Streptomyces TaxID=2593676 RepID=UPI003827FD2B
MEKRLAALPGEDFFCVEPGELLDIAYNAGRYYPTWRVRLAASDGEGIWIRLYSAGGFGVWALSWNRMPPGSGYLDHEGVRGAVFVARGALAHERARLGCAPHAEEVGAGKGFSFDETFYHRMHAVRDAGPTVTVHVFASADLQGAARGSSARGLGLPESSGG